MKQPVHISKRSREKATGFQKRFLKLQVIKKIKREFMIKGFFSPIWCVILYLFEVNKGNIKNAGAKRFFLMF